MINDSNSDMGAEIAALRNQVFSLLIALIVVTGTLVAFLYREASTTGKDLAANERLINTYNQGQPAVLAFVNQLGAYGVTHPDIHPVLQKYGIVAAPTQPSAPAPKK
jgi:hypothetical protein